MDEVRQKLNQIDLDLSKPSPATKWIQEMPLLVPVCGLILGMLIQSTFTVSPWFWSVLVCLCGMAWVGYVRSKHATALLFLCLLSTVCLGAVRWYGFTRLSAGDIGRIVPDKPVPATVQGQIVSTPTREDTDWVFERLFHLPIGMGFDFDVQAVLGRNHEWQPVSGTIRVHIADPNEPNEPHEALAIHDELQIECWLSRIRSAPNPGQFDPAETRAKRNVFVVAFVNSCLGLTKIPRQTPGGFKSLVAQLRDRAGTTLHSDTLDASAKGLLEALLLGRREDIPSPTYHVFQKTGLLHLISLSGLHVGILLAMVWGAGRFMGWLKPGRATLSLGVLLFFLLLVPPRAPTVRASVIAACFCASAYFRRQTHALNTLSLAAIILLLIRPTQLFEAGWQLSFSSVLGILILTPKLNSLIRSVWPWLYAGADTKKWQIIRLPIQWAMALTATGLGAWLGSVAVVLYHFHAVTLLSWLYTVLAVPWVALILMLGFVPMCIAMLLPWVSWVTLALLEHLVLSLERLVHMIARTDRTQIFLGSLTLVPVVFYYLWWLAAMVIKRPVYRRSACTVIAVIIMITVGLPVYRRHRPGHLELTALSVGHGQALVVRLPEGKTLLFDAGSLYRRNIGAFVVVPYLDYCGVHTIDALVVSHNDADHVNGVPEIMRHCHVRRLLVNPVFMRQIDQDGPARLLNEFVTDRGRTFEPLPNRLDLNPVVAIHALWPDPNDGAVNRLSDNNASSVILIEFARRSVLITSDIEQTVQHTLIERNPNLEVDVLMAPHHGSMTTLSPAFLAQLDPDIVLSSCSYASYREKRILSKPSYPDGYDNIHGTRLFNTARDGAVTVTIDPSGRLDVSHWLN